MGDCGGGPGRSRVGRVVVPKGRAGERLGALGVFIVAIQGGVTHPKEPMTSKGGYRNCGPGTGNAPGTQSLDQCVGIGRSGRHLTTCAPSTPSSPASGKPAMKGRVPCKQLPGSPGRLLGILPAGQSNPNSPCPMSRQKVASEPSSGEPFGPPAALRCQQHMHSNGSAGWRRSARARAWRMS